MKNLKITLFIIFIAIFSTVYLFNTLYKNKQISIELNNSINNLKLHYNITSYYNKKNADSLILAISRKKEILELLTKSLDANEEEKKIIRAKIYKIFKKKV